MSTGRKVEGIVVQNAKVVNNEITSHPDQVAGHGDLLKDKVAGTVYKPIIPVEHFFYESPLADKFRPFVPTYHGVVTLKRGGGDSQFISLEDITHRYRKPSIMDIKMGITQHLDGMSEEKKALAVAKCKNSTSFLMGFRICGIKVYDNKTQQYSSWDRFWGRDVPPDNIVQAVANFFKFTQHRAALIDTYTAEITKMVPVMKQQVDFRFVSSSLLFMFEGDTSSVASAADLHPQLKMIDFANTLPLKGGPRNEIDEGYSMGLDNIIKVLTSIKELPPDQEVHK